MERKIVVISAGVGVPSSTRLLADQLSSAVGGALADRGMTATFEVVELREHATAIATTMVGGYASPQLQHVLDTVTAADALIAVTPTFSASYSGLFKSFFDVMDRQALDGMPVLLGATGGTSRHALVLEMALRPLFSYLHAATVPTAIYAAPEDWGAGETGVTGLERRISRGATELAAALGATALGATALGATALGATALGATALGATVPPSGLEADARETAAQVIRAAEPPARRAAAQRAAMTSLPFEELLAQTQRR